VQAAPPYHECPAMLGMRAHQVFAKLQLTAQVHRPGKRGDEVVGAAFHLESVLADRPQHATRPRLLVENDHVGLGRKFPDFQRGGQPTDSCSQNGNA